MAESTNKIYYCPIEVALDLIGGRWKPLILDHLRGGSLGFEELCRLIPLATARKLSKQLRELEDDGLLERRELGEFPPPVEYTLTAAGRRLIPALDQLREIGLEFARRQGALIEDPWDFGRRAGPVAPREVSSPPHGFSGGGSTLAGGLP